MARPRGFDETAVLEKAVQCFWSRGYEAVSVRDLAAEMGIKGASLYNTFGDKRSLYRRALDHYVAQTVGDRLQRLAGAPPREALERFYAEIIERSLNDAERKGCLLVNSALEVAPHDDEFREVVAGVLKDIEAFFLHCVTAGQAEGSITTRQPAADLARLLLGALMGIRVLARTRPDRELLEGIVKPVFFLLDNL